MDPSDVIVIGTGGIGSAAAYHLARRGARVVGLDRFAHGHQHGSSHGETRIIRRAYFEHPDYVPLLNRAYDLWRALEREAGETLYRAVGLLEVGRPDGVAIPGLCESVRRHGLTLEEVPASDFPRRFPFRLSPGHQALFEADAGLLYVERAVRAHLCLAEAHGARLVAGEPVTAWRVDGDGVTVETGDRVWRASRLLIAAGAWSSALLPGLKVPLAVLRKHVHWYAAGPRFAAEAGCPCFYFETDDGDFYGIPDVGGGLKVGEHSGGTAVTDPRTGDLGVDLQDRQRVEAFLRAVCPDAVVAPLRHGVCHYTMSPDRHFIVDRHPEHDRVALVAGLSGHGFKFAPVLGEALADLVLDGATALPIDFLGLDRFSAPAATIDARQQKAVE